MKNGTINCIHKFDIVLVTILYDSLFQSLAEGLADKGLRILVIAPNRDYKRPDVISTSQMKSENLIIKRIKVPKLDKNKMLSKLLIFHIFATKAEKRLKYLKAGLYIAPMMPILVPYRIFCLSRKLKIPFILLLEDLVPDNWIRRKRFSENNPFVRFFGRQTRIMLSGAERIVAIGRDMKEYIQLTYGVAEDKVVYLPNWSKRNVGLQQKNVFKNSFGKFTILYGGTIGEAQNLVPLIKAAEMMEKTDPDVEFRIIGSGMRKRELEVMAFERGLKNIHFSDLLPEAEYKKVMKEAAVLLVSLREESKGMSVPSKTYACLAEGKPVLAVVPRNSEIHMEILEDGYGVFASPEDPEGIVDAIRKLKNDKGFYRECSENAVKAHVEKYNEKVAVEGYFRMIAEILGKRLEHEHVQ